MLKRFIFIITILFSLDLGNVALAQDPEFTQFYANPLYLNPAFAGSVRCPRFVLNYRNQWPNIQGGPYVTYSASYDQHVNALSGGLGLLVTNDNSAGILKTTNISGIYSYQLTVTRKFSIKIGFQGTYSQKSLDWNKLTFGDMIDERQGFVWNTQETGRNKKNHFDGSAGILGFSKRYFVGFAVHHLTQPDEGLLGVSPLPRKYTGHIGLIIPAGRRGNETFISPNILYQQQEKFKQLNLGLYVNKGPIVGGLWYRNKDSFIALIGFQQGMYKLGYSYDITVSKLSNTTAGSHEVSFAFQLECKQKPQKFKTVVCPSF